MSESAIYQPSEWGKAFHELPQHEALGAGAAGPGKTTCLRADSLAQIAVEHNRCNDPNFIPPGFTEPYPLEWGRSTGWALFLRRTSPMLEQTINRSALFFKSVDPGAVYSGATTTWTFSSGFKFQFGHCKDPDSWDQYLGVEVTHLSFDELVQFNQEQYEQIQARVRSDDPVLRTMLKTRAMSNPMCGRENMDGASLKNPHWVRDYFVRPWPDGGRQLFRWVTKSNGEKVKRTRIYLRATLANNPNPAFVSDYEIQLLSRPPHIRQAMLYGNWWITEGSFYGDVWNDRIHTCDSFSIPEDWPCFRSMDWGFKAPGCVHWYALSPDNELFVFREYTFQGKTATEVARRIKQIEEDEGLWNKRRSAITGPADTQLWEKRGESGKSKAEEMQDEGVLWTPADKASRERNHQRVYARLEDHKNFTQPPGLIIFKTRCPKLIETLPALQTDPDNAEVPADGGDDHWTDSLSYGCAFASRGAKGIPKMKKLDEWEDDDKSRKRKGRKGGYG